MKMCHIVLFVACLLNYFSLIGQPGYKKAIGLRLTAHLPYDFFAVSYKNYLSDHGALEFNLGFGGRNIYVPNSAGKTSFSPGISISGLYQYHQDIYTANAESLRWFAGGGMTMFHTFSKNNGYEGFGAALVPTGGIDYKFKSSPVNLTADWRPTIFITAPSAYAPVNIGTLGIAARYTF